jgi:hypothetical protein
MPTTTVVTTWSDWYPDAWFGDHHADFDHDGIRQEYLAALNVQLPAGVTLHANGDVIAEVDAADQARDLVLGDLEDQTNFVAIAQRHTILDALNDYTGDDLWENVIYRLPYDETATGRIAGPEDGDVVISGIHYTTRGGTGEWTVCCHDPAECG